MWSRLKEIVGDNHLRPATPADAVDGVQPQVVIEPGNADEVARVLKCARSFNLHVSPRGGGTKMEWGNPPRGLDAILTTHRLNRVIEHAWGDMTATVEAGCSVARFQQLLAEHGQRLALDPLWPAQATIGGILATNDSGTLRVRFGSLRDLMIGITIALPNGTIAKSGGKVVKNVAGYDLPKLLTGSLGTLGVITEAIFRLHPLPEETRSLSFMLPTTDDMNKLLLAIQDSTLVPTGLQVFLESNAAPRVDIRFEGIAAALKAQEDQLLGLAAAAQRVDIPFYVWGSREALWQDGETVMTCKLSTLPGHIGDFCESIRRVAVSFRLDWKLVVQAVGLGLLRLEGSDEQAFIAALESLRTELEVSGGSLVVLRCPLKFKASIDVWGTPGDAFPLMRRVKEQFDPMGILNPGRFVGGI